MLGMIAYNPTLHTVKGVWISKGLITWEIPESHTSRSGRRVSAFILAVDWLGRVALL